MPWYVIAYLVIAVIVAIGVWLFGIVEVADNGEFVEVMIVAPVFLMGAAIVGILWPVTAMVGGIYWRVNT